MFVVPEGQWESSRSSLPTVINRQDKSCFGLAAGTFEMVSRIGSIDFVPALRSAAALCPMKYRRLIIETVFVDRKFWMAHARNELATALSEDSGKYLKTALALHSRSRIASLSNYGRCQLRCHRAFPTVISLHTSSVSSGRNLRSLIATSLMASHSF